MNLGLKDRVALVTGGTKGIGKAIADALTEEGVRVIVCGRRINQIQGYFSYACDVTKKEDIEGVFAGISKYPNQLDILVNNAGGNTGFLSWDDISREDWIKEWEFNFLSAATVTQYALPFLKKSTQPRIINISSLVAVQTGIMNPHYGAAKSAWLSASKNLSKRFSKTGLTVNSICSNTVKAGLWEQNVKDKAQRLSISFEKAEQIMEEEVLAKSGAHRLATAEDIASLAVFLASAKAGFINGQAICVDGGEMKAIF